MKEIYKVWIFFSFESFRFILNYTQCCYSSSRKKLMNLTSPTSRTEYRLNIIINSYNYNFYNKLKNNTGT